MIGDILVCMDLPNTQLYPLKVIKKVDGNTVGEYYCYCYHAY